jgi:hypothetical protein
MAKCEHCGFGHALPDRCVNCGSTDPFPRRRVIRLLSIIVSVVLVTGFGYYFYERAAELRLAEERARAVGERVFLVQPDVVLPEEAAAGEGAISAAEIAGSGMDE